MSKRLAWFLAALVVAFISLPEALALSHGWNPDNLAPFPLALQAFVSWPGVVVGFGVALAIVIASAIRRLLHE